MNSLCEACRRIFSEESGLVCDAGHFPSNTDFIYLPYQSYTSCSRSAAIGCHLCSLILASHGRVDAEKLRDEASLKDRNARLGLYADHSSRWRIRPSFCLSQEEEDSRLVNRGWLAQSGDQNGWQFAEVQLQHEDDLLASAAIAKVTSTSTGSDESIAKIIEWIKICRMDHSVCARERSNQQRRRFRPTRLLEITLQGGELHVNLRITHELQAGYTYLTLSHTWGSPPYPWMLTKTNFDLLRRGSSLSSSDLPQTFKDAARLTFELGIYFLWIDSLCIFQDEYIIRPGVEDKDLEIPQMREVYACAVLNVMATDSIDGHGGLFRTRNGLGVQAAKIVPSWPGHAGGSLICFDHRRYQRRVTEATLNTRGWVVQERLLSVANLHFTKDEIFWECREATRSESFPDSAPYTNYYYKSWETSPARPERLHNMPLWSWSDQVEAYTRCGLTHKADKLPALSGLARDIQLRSTTDDSYAALEDYVAGLWTNKLPSQLLWKTKMTHGTARSKEYRAPSWSWASIEGEIGCSYNSEIESDEALVIIEEATTIPKSEDAYGELRDGHMIATGLLCGIHLLGGFGFFSYLPSSDFREEPRRSQWFGTVAFEGSDPIPFPVLTSPVEVTWDDIAHESPYFSGYGPQHLLFFLLVRQSTTFDRPAYIPIPTTHTEGLLLKAVTQENGTYRRVGTLSTTTPSNLEGFYRSIQENAAKQYNQGRYLKLQPEESTGLYLSTIKII